MSLCLESKLSWMVLRNPRARPGVPPRGPFGLNLAALPDAAKKLSAGLSPDAKKRLSSEIEINDTFSRVSCGYASFAVGLGMMRGDYVEHTKLFYTTLVTTEDASSPACCCACRRIQARLGSGVGADNGCGRWSASYNLG